MTVPATLTAVSITTTNKNCSSIDSSKRKNEENIISAMIKKPTEHRTSRLQQSANEIDKNFIQTVPTFRIPKKERSNNSIPLPDDSRPSPAPGKMQTNDSISSSTIENTKINSPPNRQLNDELNSQQGKRKYSLSQYQEHKRLKSNDIVQNSSADIDMRINTTENIKNPSPTHVYDNSPSISDNQQIASPKIDDITKDAVIKSNLSEPGVKKLIKKKVIWADEKNKALVETSFFEIDDSEITDIHAFARQCATNISIAQLEKLLEHDLRKRRGLQDINSFDNDDRQNLPPLPTLIRILLPDTITIPIVKSEERIAQEEREKNVLQALFIRPFLPDSPSEPDGDLLGNSTIERNEPKSIPLDDDTSSSISKQVPSINNDNNTSTSTNVSVTSTNPTPTVVSSLSSLSFDNVISPEVAQILAQAKGNLTSATTNNLSPTILTTQINPTLTTVPNVTSTSALLSALLNVTRPNGIETTNIPPTNLIGNPVLNLPLNFNLPPPTNLSLNQLLVNALSFGLPPQTTFNNALFQLPSNTFAIQSSSPIATTLNSSAMKPPTGPFAAADQGQRSSRFVNNNEHQIKNFRENNRGRHYRRGLHNNNNTRRDYYQNGNNNNNNNNNNRNIFS